MSFYEVAENLGHVLAAASWSARRPACTRLRFVVLCIAFACYYTLVCHGTFSHVCVLISAQLMEVRSLCCWQFLWVSDIIVFILTRVQYLVKFSVFWVTQFGMPKNEQ